MLQELLQAQKLMDQRQKTFERQLLVVEETVVEMKSAESTTSNRVKRKVPKDLSVQL